MDFRVKAACAQANLGGHGSTEHGPLAASVTPRCHRPEAEPDAFATPWPPRKLVSEDGKVCARRQKVDTFECSWPLRQASIPERPPPRGARAVFYRHHERRD